MNKTIFSIGDEVECINIDKLRVVGEAEDNLVAPPLQMNGHYVVQDIVLDRDGNQHLDVGLESNYARIRSIETGQELPRGFKIHWCHPSRFVKQTA